MPAIETSPTNLRRFRRRVAAHVGVFAAALLLSLAIPIAPSGAVQDGRFLEGGNLVVDYTCQGADAQTQSLLAVAGITTFPQEATILTPAVEPAPSPGEDFEMAFNWSFLLDQSLVQAGIGVGATDLNFTSSSLPMSATTGATGADVVGHPSATSLALGDGSQAVGYSVGPFTGTFNRTAAVDSPIEFTPGTVLNTVEIVPLGVTLNITCAPEQGAVMSLNDQTGVAPSTTTTTLPAVTTTEGEPSTTPTTAAVQGSGADQLPRTGASSTLMLVVLALGLIDLGYLSLRYTKSVRGRGPSSAL